MDRFKLQANYTPNGDQPAAIAKLVEGFQQDKSHQTLLGVTGSGKTFTMANVIQALQKPTLIISHNKTLAAQLYGEFKEYFPDNAVEYFVSYYDYYQPEAYIPQRDLYIEKDASINPDLDRLRLAATSSLMQRKDVIIISSVSCIYGLGSPEDYQKMILQFKTGEEFGRDEIFRKLVAIQYERNDIEFKPGVFRARGDTIDIFPSYAQTAFRIVLDFDMVHEISEINPTSGEIIKEHEYFTMYPAKHFVIPEDRVVASTYFILEELEQRLIELHKENKLLEAQRLEGRTRYDVEMLREMFYCSGIENYSRHLSKRQPGQAPATLIDYFPRDFLCIVDESHATIPQIRGMHAGDHSRKSTLVEHGFRLPSAMDNRPLMFEEWEKIIRQVLFVSATPGPYELEKCVGSIVEQLIRPTGLVDPPVEVRPQHNQIPDLLNEIDKRVKVNERTIVTTLTKRLAEELSSYIKEHGHKVHYLHSEMDAIERVEVLRDLRLGKFDCVVGVNLLREGLDLPEVSLVAILDADKEGFLRSATSLIQTIGRSARNINAFVILYGDTITKSMKKAIDETARRRKTQIAFNKKHGIKPETIRKAIRKTIEYDSDQSDYAREVVHESEETYITNEFIFELEEEMRSAAEDLKFEKAATIRDRILKIKPDWNTSPETLNLQSKRAKPKPYSKTRKKHGSKKKWK